MNCPICGAPLTIDELAGWVWTCFHCGHTVRHATDEEIFEHEGRTLSVEKCPKCGAMIYDPFGFGYRVHDVEKCLGAAKTS